MHKKWLHITATLEVSASHRKSGLFDNGSFATLGVFDNISQWRRMLGNFEGDGDEKFGVKARGLKVLDQITWKIIVV